MSEAQPPALPASTFTSWFLRRNGIDGAAFGGWVLGEGMGFASSVAWWGRGGERPRPHEGVDLRVFFMAGGERRELSAGTLVPALYAGVVRAVVADFVDQTVWLRHGDYRLGPRVLHSAYAHVRPAEGVMPGAVPGEGEVLARVAASARKTAPPAHLHLSVALVHEAVEDGMLDWGRIHEGPGVRFLDPGPLLAFP